MIDSAKVILTFPCSFPIKAFGRSSADFESIVTEIVRRHAPDLPANAVTSRPSGAGNYLAVTATITARSREQLDALYMELTSHEQVLMVL
jgi:putative lipoic acid-binding regulatory protein